MKDDALSALDIAPTGAQVAGAPSPACRYTYTRVTRSGELDGPPLIATRASANKPAVTPSILNANRCSPAAVVRGGAGESRLRAD